MQRLSPIDEETPEEKSENSKIQTDELLTVKDLSLGYPDESKKLAQKHQLFDTKNGEKLGICGSVGSGKSTLFNLISRIYDPPEKNISEWIGYSWKTAS